MKFEMKLRKLLKSFYLGKRKYKLDDLKHYKPIIDFLEGRMSTLSYEGWKTIWKDFEEGEFEITELEPGNEFHSIAAKVIKREIEPDELF